MVAAVRVVDVVDVQQARRVLEQVAQACAPRVELHGDDVAVLDVSGLRRLIGTPEAIGAEIHRQGAARGVRLVVAMAATRVAALLMVQVPEHLRTTSTRSTASDTVIVPAGCEPRTLQGLPLTVLEALAWVWVRPGGSLGAREDRSNGARQRRGRSGHYRLAPAPALASASDAPPSMSSPDAASGPLSMLAARSRAARGGATATATTTTGAHRGFSPQAVHDTLATVRRWGVRTLGELAALPPAEIYERLGAVGVALQHWARGEDGRPLVPTIAPPEFAAGMALEWPIEGLEPLSFVMSRVLEDVCQQLARHDRGAVRVQVLLRLVTRAVHERAIDLPAPMCDAKVLRTLVLLDLEAHPPVAGVDDVRVRVEVAPGRIVQHSLLTRAVPTPEALATVISRLNALMGEGRCGAPALVDTYRPGACAMQPFRAFDTTERFTASPAPSIVVRRCRPPIAIRVDVVDGRPARVRTRGGFCGGVVRQWAGPWRTSGAWWQLAAMPPAQAPDGEWDVDEWDVELSDGAAYRLSRSRRSGHWFLDGVLD